MSDAVPVNDPSVDLRPEPLGSAVAQSLIGELNRELGALYPEPGATHFRLDPDEVAPGRGAFLVAWLDGAPVGCGAVRRIDGDTAEIKRMYVAPTLRDRGIGRVLLAGLEAAARELGVRRLVLETGVRQHAAIALYARAGFREIPHFGEYASSTVTSVCMAKLLSG